MSTGDLARIQPGEVCHTVFTTPIGRMVDLATVVAFENSLLMLSSYVHREKLLRWLRKYVFFNDDVQFSDESQILSHIGVFDIDDSTPTPMIEAIQKNTQGVFPNATFAVATQPLGYAGWHMIGLSEVPVVDPLAKYEDLRIRHGVASAPNEINEDYIPLEAGLWGAVSFNKGCYIGQEIIARMEARGQLAKKLMCLQTQVGAAVGDDLISGNDNVGKLTSVTPNGTYALGYVRSAFAHQGQKLKTHTGNDITVL
jgi:folate-binding protein YgfZ